MNNSITAIILVGGKGTRLKGLTKNKTKSYVSILGKYRIIDFPLSALSNSGIYDIGILTQYEPFQLMRYIGSGASWDADTTTGGISFLTPYEANIDEIFFQKGTANAVLSQIGYIEKSPSDYILILPGDQMYKIDFREVLKFHQSKNAALTIVETDYFGEDLNRFGIIEQDENNAITGFSEKPDHPKTNHISCGIYLFNKDVILEYLKKADTLVDFGRNLIPYIISDRNDVYAYKHDGLFKDIGTVQSLFDINMHYIDHPENMFVKGSKFKVYSKPFDYPPHKILKDASVKMSFIADGSEVGGEVYHSVLSFYSKVMEKSQVSYSLLLPKAIVEKNCIIKNAIIDEDVTVPENSVFVFDEPTIIDEDFLKEHSHV